MEERERHTKQNNGAMPIELFQIQMKDALPFLVNGDNTGIGGAENEDYFIEKWRAATKTPRDMAITQVENLAEYHRIQVVKVQLMVDLLAKVGENDVVFDMIRPLFDVLIEEGFNYEFTQESFMDDLKNVVAESQTSLMNFEEAAKDRDEMIRKSSSGGKADFAYYAKLTNIMSKSAGFPVTLDLNCEQWAGHYVELFTKKPKKNERAER